MAQNNYFRISELMSDEIKRLGLTAAAGRALMAFIYLDERRPSVSLDPKTNNFRQVVKEAFVSEFRELGLAKDSRSSRFLKRPIYELQQTGLFKFLVLSPDGKSVSWEFSSAAQDLQRGYEYGLVPVEDIALCSSAIDVMILTLSAVRMRMKWPAFRLFPFDYPSSMSTAPLAPDISSLLSAKDLRGFLKPAINKWARRKGVDYFVECVRKPGFSGYTEVVIRMRHEGTMWSNDQFHKQTPRSRCYIVKGADLKTGPARS